MDAALITAFPGGLPPYALALPPGLSTNETLTQTLCRRAVLL